MMITKDLESDYVWQTNFYSLSEDKGTECLIISGPSNDIVYLFLVVFCLWV
jgi:hypothetical protein